MARWLLLLCAAAALQRDDAECAREEGQPLAGARVVAACLNTHYPEANLGALSPEDQAMYLHLGLNFKPTEIATAVEFTDWARYGKGKFYDLTLNPWPICKQLYVPETQTQHTVPLPEDELLEGTLLTWEE